MSLFLMSMHVLTTLKLKLYGIALVVWARWQDVERRYWSLLFLAPASHLWAVEIQALASASAFWA